MLDDQLAVPHAELEARLCQQGFQYDGTRQWLHPHIVTEALRDLRALHAVDEVFHETRGGRSERLLVVADRRRRETAVMRAIRRKGLLYARFLLMSNHTGAAGEEVLRHSLMTADAHLVPMEPGFARSAT